MTIEQELAQAQARVAEVEAERDAARAQAQTNFTNLQAMTAERDTFSAQVADLTNQLSSRAGEITNLQAQLSQAAQDFQTYKDSEAPRFNALLQAELAKTGLPEPVQASGTSTVVTDDTPTDPKQRAINNWSKPSR